MKESGFILPSLLLTVTLMLIAIIPLHNAIIRVLRGKSELSLAFRADTNASSDALRSAFQFASVTKGRQSNKCFIGQNKASRISIQRSFCASYYLAPLNLLNQPLIDSSIYPEAQDFPRLDFEALFSDSNPCDLPDWQTISAISYSNSARSVFSSQNCQLKSAALEHNVTIAANLKIPFSMKLKAEKLAIRGFLISDLNIELSRDSHTIAAGGDLDIASLSTTLPSEITLISATGNVILKSLKGPLSVKVFAAGKSSLPPNLKLSSQGFEHLSLNFLPLGFENTD